MIQNAKYSGQGYEVTYDNGDIYVVPNAEGNRHHKELMQWVDNGNVIGAEFTQDEIEEAEKAESISTAKSNLSKTNIAVTVDMNEKLSDAEQTAVADFRAENLQVILDGGVTGQNDEPVYTNDLVNGLQKVGVAL